MQTLDNHDLNVIVQSGQVRRGIRPSLPRSSALESACGGRALGPSSCMFHISSECVTLDCGSCYERLMMQKAMFNESAIS